MCGLSVIVLAVLVCLVLAWVRLEQGHGLLDALLSAVTLAVAPVRMIAQEGHSAAAAPVDIITPHITDAHYIEVPSLSFAHGFAREIEKRFATA